MFDISPMLSQSFSTFATAKNMTPYQTVAMHELLDAADLFAAKGNAQAALACQIAKTKEDVEKIISKYGSNQRLQNALKAFSQG